MELYMITDEDGNTFLGDRRFDDYKEGSKPATMNDVTSEQITQYLVREATNGNYHNMATGYEKLHEILKTNLHPVDIKLVLWDIAKIGGIHDLD